MLLFTVLVLLVLIALAIPVGAALGILALALDWEFGGWNFYPALGEITWQYSIEFILAAVPLFILLGEILLRSGIAERMYGAMVQWLSWLPGGLMHSNIGACAMFAATSGSSVATAATIGTVALPQAEKRGYNERLFLGTLAAGGTLGILVPPSINLIIYGLLTDTSVPQLYLAGFIPGLLLATLFMATVIIACTWKREWGGTPVETSWASRIASLPHLLPPAFIFLVVIGSIYAGFATPTEAASLGVVAALVLAAANRTLTFRMLRDAIEGTMRTTAMVMIIILAAIFLNFLFGLIGLTQQLTDFVTGLGWGPTETMIALIIFFIILGCFMETFSMLLTTTPLVAPIVFSMGFDPVWYGILLTVLLETALITPPIGVNLYVVQGVRKGGAMNDVIIGALPFVVTMFAMLVLLMVFPGLATWLPSLFF
ncbi:MAG: TRAP transporter large permease [Alphaproteobacteria bacterium]